MMFGFGYGYGFKSLIWKLYKLKNGDMVIKCLNLGYGYGDIEKKKE